jgi:hypothetical protein
MMLRRHHMVLGGVHRRSHSFMSRMGRITVTRLLGQLLYLVLERQLLYAKLRRIGFMALVVVEIFLLEFPTGNR